MHRITEGELKKLLAERLAALRTFFVERKQQCLETEEGFFVEIVLNDASKISAAEKEVEGLKAELAQQDMELDAVIRALWKVKGVRLLGAPPAESGGIMASVRFHAVLESGGVEQVVEVDVSKAAEQELKSRTGGLDSESLKRLVENFLSLQLSAGGTSYWDPVRYRHQDVGPAAVLYLLHHSPMTAA